MILTNLPVGTLIEPGVHKERKRGTIGSVMTHEVVEKHISGRIPRSSIIAGVNHATCAAKLRASDVLHKRNLPHARMRVHGTCFDLQIKKF